MVSLGLLAVPIVDGKSTGVEEIMNTPLSVPAIDKERPSETELATFALG